MPVNGICHKGHNNFWNQQCNQKAYSRPTAKCNVKSVSILKIQWAAFKCGIVEKIWTESSEPWALSIEQWTELIVIFQNTSNACEYIQFNAFNWWNRYISITIVVIIAVSAIHLMVCECWMLNVEFWIANGWHKEKHSQIYPKMKWSSCSANQIKFNEFQIFSANNLKMFLCFLDCCWIVVLFKRD